MLIWTSWAEVLQLRPATLAVDCLTENLSQWSAFPLFSPYFQPHFSSILALGMRIMLRYAANWKCRRLGSLQINGSVVSCPVAGIWNCMVRLKTFSVSWTVVVVCSLTLNTILQCRPMGFSKKTDDAFTLDLQTKWRKNCVACQWLQYLNNKLAFVNFVVVDTYRMIDNEQSLLNIIDDTAKVTKMVSCGKRTLLFCKRTV